MISIHCKSCKQRGDLLSAHVCPECHALYCHNCNTESEGVCPACGATLQYLQ